jgi:hypothetical protein
LNKNILFKKHYSLLHCLDLSNKWSDQRINGKASRGVNAMLTIFGDFLIITDIMIHFLHKPAVPILSLWRLADTRFFSPKKILQDRRKLVLRFLWAVRGRAARWYIFKPKIPNWENLGGSGKGRCLCILWPFSLFYGYLVYFMAIWYILWEFGVFFPCFGKKNLATLGSML